jgi:hypothetical protein
MYSTKPVRVTSHREEEEKISSYINKALSLMTADDIKKLEKFYLQHFKDERDVNQILIQYRRDLYVRFPTMETRSDLMAMMNGFTTILVQDATRQRGPIVGLSQPRGQVTVLVRRLPPIVEFTLDFYFPDLNIDLVPIFPWKVMRVVDKQVSMLDPTMELCEALMEATGRTLNREQKRTALARLQGRQTYFSSLSKLVDHSMAVYLTGGLSAAEGIMEEHMNGYSHPDNPKMGGGNGLVLYEDSPLRSLMSGPGKPKGELSWKGGYIPVVDSIIDESIYLDEDTSVDQLWALVKKNSDSGFFTVRASGFMYLIYCHKRKEQSWSSGTPNGSFSISDFVRSLITKQGEMPGILAAEMEKGEEIGTSGWRELTNDAIYAQERLLAGSLVGLRLGVGLDPGSLGAHNHCYFTAIFCSHFGALMENYGTDLFDADALLVGGKGGPDESELIYVDMYTGINSSQLMGKPSKSSLPGYACSAIPIGKARTLSFIPVPESLLIGTLPHRDDGITTLRYLQHLSILSDSHKKELVHSIAENLILLDNPKTNFYLEAEPIKVHQLDTSIKLIQEEDISYRGKLSSVVYTDVFPTPEWEVYNKGDSNPITLTSSTGLLVETNLGEMQARIRRMVKHTSGHLRDTLERMGHDIEGWVWEGKMPISPEAGKRFYIIETELFSLGLICHHYLDLKAYREEKEERRRVEIEDVNYGMADPLDELYRLTPGDHQTEEPKQDRVFFSLMLHDKAYHPEHRDEYKPPKLPMEYRQMPRERHFTLADILVTKLSQPWGPRLSIPRNRTSAFPEREEGQLPYCQFTEVEAQHILRMEVGRGFEWLISRMAFITETIDRAGLVREKGRQDKGQEKARKVQSRGWWLLSNSDSMNCTYLLRVTGTMTDMPYRVICNFPDTKGHGLDPPSCLFVQPLGDGISPIFTICRGQALHSYRMIGVASPLSVVEGLDKRSATAMSLWGTQGGHSFTSWGALPKYINPMFFSQSLDSNAFWDKIGTYTPPKAMSMMPFSLVIRDSLLTVQALKKRTRNMYLVTPSVGEESLLSECFNFPQRNGRYKWTGRGIDGSLVSMMYRRNGEAFHLEMEMMDGMLDIMLKRLNHDSILSEELKKRLLPQLEDVPIHLLTKRGFSKDASENSLMVLKEWFSLMRDHDWTQDWHAPNALACIGAALHQSVEGGPLSNITGSSLSFELSKAVRRPARKQEGPRASITYGRGAATSMTSTALVLSRDPESMNMLQDRVPQYNPETSAALVSSMWGHTQSKDFVPIDIKMSSKDQAAGTRDISTMRADAKVASTMVEAVFDVLSSGQFGQYIKETDKAMVMLEKILSTVEADSREVNIMVGDASKWGHSMITRLFAAEAVSMSAGNLPGALQVVVACHIFGDKLCLLPDSYWLDYKLGTLHTGGLAEKVPLLPYWAVRNENAQYGRRRPTREPDLDNPQMEPDGTPTIIHGSAETGGFYKYDRKGALRFIDGMMMGLFNSASSAHAAIAVYISIIKTSKSISSEDIEAFMAQNSFEFMVTSDDSLAVAHGPYSPELLANYIDSTRILGFSLNKFKTMVSRVNSPGSGSLFEINSLFTKLEAGSGAKSSRFIPYVGKFCVTNTSPAGLLTGAWEQGLSTSLQSADIFSRSDEVNSSLLFHLSRCLAFNFCRHGRHRTILHDRWLDLSLGGYPPFFPERSLINGPQEVVWSVEEPTLVVPALALNNLAGSLASEYSVVPRGEFVATQDWSGMYGFFSIKPLSVPKRKGEAARAVYNRYRRLGVSLRKVMDSFPYSTQTVEGSMLNSAGKSLRLMTDGAEDLNPKAWAKYLASRSRNNGRYGMGRTISCNKMDDYFFSGVIRNLLILGKEGSADTQFLETYTRAVEAFGREGGKMVTGMMSQLTQITGMNLNVNLPKVPLKGVLEIPLTSYQYDENSRMVQYLNRCGAGADLCQSIVPGYPYSEKLIDQAHERVWKTLRLLDDKYYKGYKADVANYIRLNAKRKEDMRNGIKSSIPRLEEPQLPHSRASSWVFSSVRSIMSVSRNKMVFTSSQLGGGATPGISTIIKEMVGRLSNQGPSTSPIYYSQWDHIASKTDAELTPKGIEDLVTTGRLSSLRPKNIGSSLSPGFTIRISLAPTVFSSLVPLKEVVFRDYNNPITLFTSMAILGLTDNKDMQQSRCVARVLMRAAGRSDFRSSFVGINDHEVVGLYAKKHVPGLGKRVAVCRIRATAERPAQWDKYQVRTLHIVIDQDYRIGHLGGTGGWILSRRNRTQRKAHDCTDLATADYWDYSLPAVVPISGRFGGGYVPSILATFPVPNFSFRAQSKLASEEVSAIQANIYNTNQVRLGERSLREGIRDSNTLRNRGAQSRLGFGQMITRGQEENDRQNRSKTRLNSTDVIGPGSKSTIWSIPILVPVDYGVMRGYPQFTSHPTIPLIVLDPQGVIILHVKSIKRALAHDYIPIKRNRFPKLWSYERDPFKVPNLLRPVEAGSVMTEIEGLRKDEGWARCLSAFVRLLWGGVLYTRTHFIAMKWYLKHKPTAVIIHFKAGGQRIYPLYASDLDKIEHGYLGGESDNENPDLAQVGTWKRLFAAKKGAGVEKGVPSNSKEFIRPYVVGLRGEVIGTPLYNEGVTIEEFTRVKETNYSLTIVKTAKITVFWTQKGVLCSTITPMEILLPGIEGLRGRSREEEANLDAEHAILSLDESLTDSLVRKAAIRSMARSIGTADSIDAIESALIEGSDGQDNWLPGEQDMTHEDLLGGGVNLDETPLNDGLDWL